MDPTKRYLYFQVLGGKAFLEHLQDPEPMPGKVTSTFTLFVHFKGQRFRSRSVPCACEPDINEGECGNFCLYPPLQSVQNINFCPRDASVSNYLAAKLF